MSYLEERRNQKIFGKLQKEKKVYHIPKQSEKKKLQVAAKKQVIEDSDLEKWFVEIAKEIAKKPYCSECGSYISLQHHRHATAHILPKKIYGGFPSVATHPLNYLILGSQCGCHQQTHRWDTFQKMNVWPLAVQRFIIIEPSIAAAERRNIPGVLLKQVAGCGSADPDDIKNIL